MMKRKNFAIVNYGVANYNSIIGTLNQLGQNYIVTSDKFELKKSDFIILPGVGTFPSAKEELKKLQLINFLKQLIIKGKPTLGICLGMHLLTNSSEEISYERGLDLIPGNVKPNHLKKHQIGWNKVSINKKKSIFSNLDNKFFYFQHSFSYTGGKSFINGHTTFNKKQIPSIIVKKNIVGVQFHPEKSQENGLIFFKNFIKYFL